MLFILPYGLCATNEKRGIDKMNLYDANSNKLIQVGDKVKTFRDELVTITGWEERPFPSTGRVFFIEEDGYDNRVQGGVYPGVVNAKIGE